MGSAAAPLLSTPHDLVVLVVDTEAETARYAGLLQSSYRVAVTSQVDVAKQFLHRSTPSLVLAELVIDGQSGVEICREAKSLHTPPSVLVTTANPERVPDALAAGCDGVLLKPFQPNLLFARLGRLLRARAEQLRTKAERQHLKAVHLRDRSDLLLAGTNRVWPITQCPYCSHAGVTSFEFAAYRRAWYACVECKKVWIAKRQE